MKSLAADPVSRISEQTRMRHKHRHRVISLRRWPVTISSLTIVP